MEAPMFSWLESRMITMNCSGPSICKWIIFVTLLVEHVYSKGVAVIGSGGGDRTICTECAGNYTQEEMNMALLIVGGILFMFLLILACQCYSRVMWECSGDVDILSNYKEMPPPPYSKRTINPIIHQLA